MKTYTYILFFLFTATLSAQTALYNNGNLRIHENGAIGFHTNFINDAPTDNNLGLAGFYGTELLTVSGNVTPQFHDMEIALDNDLQLQLGMDNTNNTNFIFGSILTPLSDSDIFYNFIDTSFYSGENDFSKIEGYAAITDQQNFGFPVGDVQFLRPLIMNSESTNLFAKCAYFFENPNNPNSLPETFDTSATDLDVALVNTFEFWKLEGTVSSTVTLSWNERSTIESLTDNVDEVIPVGWSKASQQWVNLTGSIPVGTLSEGFVTTEAFVPDDYEIITLGSSESPFEPLSRDVLFIDNFFISVNGDGINDTFFIEELQDFESNFLQIYDRYGLKVFEQTDYFDEFRGFSNQGNVPYRAEEGLPTGVYFYTVYIPEDDLNYQGFLYLSR